MTDPENITEEAGPVPGLSKLSLAAGFVALAGVADAVYLQSIITTPSRSPQPYRRVERDDQPYATLGGLLTAVMGEAAAGIASSGIGEVPLAALGGSLFHRLCACTARGLWRSPDVEGFRYPGDIDVPF